MMARDKAQASDRAATRRVTVAVDAMGGDRGPSAVIAGLARSAEKNPDIRFLVFGDRAQIDPLLSRRKQLTERCEVRHAEGVVTMDAKPSHAMRNGKGTSMWESIDSVRNGEAQVCVSCGNTGALMAMSMVGSPVQNQNSISMPSKASSTPCAASSARSGESSFSMGLVLLMWMSTLRTLLGRRAS